MASFAKLASNDFGAVLVVIFPDGTRGIARRLSGNPSKVSLDYMDEGVVDVKSRAFYEDSRVIPETYFIGRLSEDEWHRLVRECEQYPRKVREIIDRLALKSNPAS